MSVQHGAFGDSVIRDEKRPKEGREGAKGKEGDSDPRRPSQKARESPNGNLFKNSFLCS